MGFTERETVVLARVTLRIIALVCCAALDDDAVIYGWTERGEKPRHARAESGPYSRLDIV